MEMTKEQKEAIEELEEFIKAPCETCKYCELAYKLNRKNIIQLLNLNKKLQKENEELKNEIMEKDLEKIGIEEYTKESMKEIIEEYYTANEDCVSKQKIKDKIEELNQYYKKGIYPSLYQWSDITITEHYDDMIELLQELLESEEN